jgi:hypothetical protein
MKEKTEVRFLHNIEGSVKPSDFSYISVPISSGDNRYQEAGSMLETMKANGTKT